jgi:methylase of polypeptide subunit release factors
VIRKVTIENNDYVEIKYLDLNLLVNEFVMTPRKGTQAIIFKLTEWLNINKNNNYNKYNDDNNNNDDNDDNNDNNNTNKYNVLDLGTGSGCLLLSILKLFINNSFKNSNLFFGIDFSENSLTILAVLSVELSLTTTIFEGKTVCSTKDCKVRAMNFSSL